MCWACVLEVRKVVGCGLRRMSYATKLERHFSPEYVEV